MLRKTSAQATLSLCCGDNIMKTVVTCFIVVGLGMIAIASYASRPVAQPVACPCSGANIAPTNCRPTSEPHAGLPTAKVERGNLIRTVPAKER